MQHGRHLVEGAVQRPRIIQVEDVVGEAQLGGEALDFGGVAPGQDGAQPLRNGHARRGFADEAISAV